MKLIKNNYVIQQNIYKQKIYSNSKSILTENVRITTNRLTAINQTVQRKQKNEQHELKTNNNKKKKLNVISCATGNH